MTDTAAKRSLKAGLPPGTPIYIGGETSARTRVTLINYDAETLTEKDLGDVKECVPYKDSPTVTWLDVDGIYNLEVLWAVSECFGLHPLVVEDIANTEQRPKLEDYGDYVYIVLRSLFFDDETSRLTTEQNSLVVGRNFVLSFQEEEGDDFDPVRNRIRSGNARIRKMGADYLAYELLDALVDNYFLVLEKIGEKIEAVEDALIANPDRETLRLIHDLKRALIFVRKAVWPLREVLAGLERRESPIFQKGTMTYVRDVYDHTVQIIDTVETYRDMISGILDIYLSSVSNRLNEVMKVLTIIATVFIPLTFIAGVYGMNFKYMPELGLRWSYPLLWLIMIAIGGTMLLYFRRRRWF